MKWIRFAFIFLCFWAVLPEKLFADALENEIARWREFIETNPSQDPAWLETRMATIHGIAKAKIALSSGYRLYALHLVATVRPRLAMHQYLGEYPPDLLSQTTAVEAEIKRIREKLQPVISGQVTLPVDALSAAIQAIAEVSFAQIKRYYENSMEYPTKASALDCLRQILMAQAEYEFVQWCALLRSKTSKKQPGFSNLNREIDLFENEILSSAKLHNDQSRLLIQQSRQLALSGMEYGSLYRLLTARILHFLNQSAESYTSSQNQIKETAAKLKSRFGTEVYDHSIGELFWEMAVYEATEMTHDESRGLRLAQIIFQEVIPRYFASNS